MPNELAAPAKSQRNGVPHFRFPGGTPLAVRMAWFTEPEPNTGCHLWTACLTAGGYGMITLPGGKREKAYRVAYELAKGPVPPGLQLDHLCRVRCCVNPDHLEAVTSGVNTLRGDTLTGRYARRTHCKNGHLLAGDNLYPSPGTRRYRRCRTCTLQQTMLSKRRTRARDRALKAGVSQ